MDDGAKSEDGDVDAGDNDRRLARDRTRRRERFNRRLRVVKSTHRTSIVILSRRPRRKFLLPHFLAPLAAASSAFGSAMRRSSADPMSAPPFFMSSSILALFAAPSSRT